MGIVGVCSRIFASISQDRAVIVIVQIIVDRSLLSIVIRCSIIREKFTKVYCTLPGARIAAMAFCMGSRASITRVLYLNVLGISFSGCLLNFLCERNELI